MIITKQGKNEMFCRPGLSETCVPIDCWFPARPSLPDNVTPAITHCNHQQTMGAYSEIETTKTPGPMFAPHISVLSV